MTTLLQQAEQLQKEQLQKQQLVEAIPELRKAEQEERQRELVQQKDQLAQASLDSNMPLYYSLKQERDTLITEFLEFAQRVNAVGRKFDEVSAVVVRGYEDLADCQLRRGEHPAGMGYEPNDIGNADILANVAIQLAKNDAIFPLSSYTRKDQSTLSLGLLNALKVHQRLFIE